MYDCIIVGAGPSGGTAAYHLAKRGHSVLLIERASLPRYKPCGGGVSPQVAEWFDFDFSPVISQRVRHIRCTWEMEDAVEAEVPADEALWMVRRDEFDYFLVQQAQQQGAELWQATKAQGIEFVSDRWRVETSRGPVEGRYLIAADGGRGTLSRWLGLSPRPDKIAAAVEIEPRLPMPDQALLHLEFGMVPYGYLWNFPKADGYSIGGGVFAAYTKRRYDLRPLLTTYADQFGVQVAQEKAYGHPILIWDKHRTLHTQQALIAGEAARVVDPFTAEGIRPAIFSGMQAAVAVHAALGGDRDALPRYTETMQTEWGQEMVWAKRLAKLFYNVPKVAYQVAVKHPDAAPQLIKLFNGKQTYASITQRTVNRLSRGLLGRR
ncbi:geranylgeranyl reductase family protein [Leptolyngbya iicbica]|uniref:Geranylgeranyl reductase family protein n=2 Tax=Cyanophyceae TaxID=3028117 RepID=A0A4Q7EFW1_9CYAN|nr:geranylgeranyl reductase family protein [Leptolyngbya sp. LK]RZM81926.1 geranylgeranyl reductase family protein [Leptolyngbya sp. LK]